MSKISTLHEKEIELVSLMFRKSGISTLSKFKLPKEKSKKIFCDIDVLGVCNNIVILVECVGEESLGNKIKDFDSETEIIKDKFDHFIRSIKNDQYSFYKKCRTTFEDLKSEIIVKKLIVVSSRENVDEEKKVWKDKLFIWGKEDVEYFKIISDTTYNHCKFEIFHSLEIKPSDIIEKKHEEPTSVSYIATGEEDEEKYIVTFPAPVRSLLERSFVMRYHYDPEKGFQRLLDKQKLKRMRKYLLKEKKPYPNSIIVVLDPDVKITKFDAKNFFTSKIAEDIKKTRGKNHVFGKCTG